jgi:hypothetical protein
MIDTDKYEGHDNWEGTKVNMANEANKLLIADAPLLLAEVIRLRNHIRRMRHWAEPKMHEVHHDAWRKLHEEIYEGDEEE